MRWHPLVKKFALNLKHLSTSAYQAVHENGVINLPSERTLLIALTGPLLTANLPVAQHKVHTC